jgi:hypothetical protein
LVRAREIERALAHFLKMSLNVVFMPEFSGGNSMSENPDYLVTAASIMAGFGSVFFAFRLQRELTVYDRNRDKNESEPTWIALADCLLIVAIIISLVFVVVPVVSAEKLAQASVERARAACAAAAIMIAGYIPSILAHYNFIFWLRPDRPNPTVSEALWVILTLVVAILVYRGNLPWW